MPRLSFSKPPTKRSLPAKHLLRRYIESRDDWTCVYCGEPGDQLDHVAPESIGGPTTRANLVIACQECNGRKGVDTADEWLAIGFRHLLRKGEDLGWLDE